MPFERLDDADERRAEPLCAEGGLASDDRVSRDPDDPDHGRDEHRRPQAAEQAARHRLPGLARLLGQVRERLEARVREHGQRQRVREVVPARGGAGMHALPEVVEREEQAESEADQDHLRDERDGSDDHRDSVEPRAADQPQHRDRQDDEHRADDVPRVVSQPLPADRVAEVVRREERREGDHDRVVEEQHPARQEPDRIVERAAGEHRRAARLGDRRRPLGVRERDEHEQRPDAEQHPGRQAEREERNDPEREVDRRAHLAVGDRGERPSGQAADESWQAARHYLVAR